MRRLVIIGAVLLALAGQTAALDFSIRESCQSSETAMFSMSNRTNAHAAGPSYYQDYTGSLGREGQQVCASADVEEIEIAAECQEYINNPVLSFRDPEAGTSHLSADEDAYEYTLCSANLATTVRRSCPGRSTPIVSMYGPIENHIAEPGHYDWQICGALFENSTLAYEFTMSGNTTFVTNGGFGVYNTTETREDLPGYATVQNDQALSGIVGSNLFSQDVTSTKFGDRARVSITQPGQGQGQWFLPFTPGNTIDIEERFDLIMERTFMSQFNPNFAFELAENTLVTISLSFEDVDLIDDIRRGPGVYEIQVTNEGENDDGQPQVGLNVTAQ